MIRFNALKTLAFAACAAAALAGQPSEAANTVIRSYGNWSSYVGSYGAGATIGVITEMRSGATVAVHPEGEGFVLRITKSTWRLDPGQSIKFRLRVGAEQFNGNFVARSETSIAVRNVPLSFMKAMIESSDAVLEFADQRWDLDLGGFSSAMRDALRRNQT